MRIVGSRRTRYGHLSNLTDERWANGVDLRGRADSDELSSLQADVPALFHKPNAGLTLTGRSATVQPALESEVGSYPLDPRARGRGVRLILRFGFRRLGQVRTMESIMTSTSDLTPAPAPTTGVVLLVDSSQTDPHTAALDYAIAVAQRDQVALTIYDRSEETWGDSQHPDGPMDLDDSRLDDRPDLRGILQVAADKGVTPNGWVSTLPSVSAVTSALGALEADLVVIPDNLHQKLLERALSGNSTGESLATQIDRNPTLDAVVVVVSNDGTRVLAETSN